MSWHSTKHPHANGHKTLDAIHAQSGLGQVQEDQKIKVILSYIESLRPPLNYMRPCLKNKQASKNQFGHIMEAKGQPEIDMERGSRSGSTLTGWEELMAVLCKLGRAIEAEETQRTRLPTKAAVRCGSHPPHTVSTQRHCRWNSPGGEDGRPGNPRHPAVPVSQHWAHRHMLLCAVFSR